MVSLWSASCPCRSVSCPCRSDRWFCFIQVFVFHAGLVGLQAATAFPQQVPAVMVINISLRMLHVTKQSPLQRPFVAALQNTLRETDVGKWFFASVAKPQVCVHYSRSIIQ